MKKQSSLVVLGLLTVSLLCAPVYGQPPFEIAFMGPGGPGVSLGDGPGMMLPLLLKGVDLTTEQQVRVKEIMLTQRKTLHALFQQLHAAHEEMADKLFAPGEVTAEDLAPQVQRMTQLREQLMRNGLTVMLEVRKVLTPEQLAKAAQLKEKMQALHNEMRGLLHEKGSEGEPEEDVLFFHNPNP